MTWRDIAELAPAAILWLLAVTVWVFVAYVEWWM